MAFIGKQWKPNNDDENVIVTDLPQSAFNQVSIQQWKKTVPRLDCISCICYFCIYPLKHLVYYVCTCCELLWDEALNKINIARLIFCQISSVKILSIDNNVHSVNFYVSSDIDCNIIMSICLCLLLRVIFTRIFWYLIIFDFFSLYYDS